MKVALSHVCQFTKLGLVVRMEVMSMDSNDCNVIGFGLTFLSHCVHSSCVHVSGSVKRRVRRVMLGTTISVKGENVYVPPLGSELGKRS
jgi:hypothetical protein